MKSSERKTECPVCHREVSADFLKNHIAQMARQERASNLQANKKHNEFLCYNG